MVKPYARTVIGWTASGETVIMTVDGKDGVSGATAHQLVSLLQSINVVTALDLDGGNSTTLYAQGRVLNRPSHGIERPVSTGLLIVGNP
jgi:exopolysaccharide biosynthesis protein